MIHRSRRTSPRRSPLSASLRARVYIANDWIDRDADRAHPIKRDRPIAAGRISLAASASLSVTLGVGGFCAGDVGRRRAGRDPDRVSCPERGVLAWASKRMVIIDVIAVALGFLLRLLAGTLGVGIAPSPWLLMCGLMLTLLLGFGKRRAELCGGQRRFRTPRARRIFSRIARSSHYRMRQRNADLLQSLHDQPADDRVARQREPRLHGTDRYLRAVSISCTCSTGNTPPRIRAASCSPTIICKARPWRG